MKKKVFTAGLSYLIEDPYITGLLMILRDHGNIDDSMITDGVLEDISFHTNQYPTAIVNYRNQDEPHQTLVSYSEDYYDYD